MTLELPTMSERTSNCGMLRLVIMTRLSLAVMPWELRYVTA